MVKNALWDISYGLYIVTTTNGSREDEKYNGQIVNTVSQVTAEPAQIAVGINKGNLTHDYLMKSKKFGISILEQDAPMTFIGKWGFKSGRDINKFEDTGYKTGENGIPLVLDYTLSLLEGRIVSTVDVGTHTLFVGEITNSEVLKEGVALTYEYYQRVKKGKAPKAAPTFRV